MSTLLALCMIAASVIVLSFTLFPRIGRTKWEFLAAIDISRLLRAHLYMVIVTISASAYILHTFQVDPSLVKSEFTATSILFLPVSWWYGFEIFRSKVRMKESYVDKMKGIFYDHRLQESLESAITDVVNLGKLYQRYNVAYGASLSAVAILNILAIAVMLQP